MTFFIFLLPDATLYLSVGCALPQTSSALIPRPADLKISGSLLSLEDDVIQDDGEHVHEA